MSVLDRQAEAVSQGDWPLPEMGGELDARWVDSFIAIRLADVMARRHYGVSFTQLSVEDRVVVRGECESFVERQTWIAGKRERHAHQ